MYKSNFFLRSASSVYSPSAPWLNPDLGVFGANIAARFGEETEQMLLAFLLARPHGVEVGQIPVFRGRRANVRAQIGVSAHNERKHHGELGLHDALGQRRVRLALQLAELEN
jgi:hypothetical protein